MNVLLCLCHSLAVLTPPAPLSWRKESKPLAKRGAARRGGRPEREQTLQTLLSSLLCLPPLLAAPQLPTTWCDSFARRGGPGGVRTATAEEDEGGAFPGR